MRPISRTVAWLSLLFVVGVCAFVSGYYFGIGKGAEAQSVVDARNSVSDSIGELRVAFAALGRNDLEYSRAQHEIAIHKALLDIGGYATVGGLPTWDCKPMHRTTMNEARLYLIQHPPAPNDRMGEMMQKAAELCR